MSRRALGCACLVVLPLAGCTGGGDAPSVPSSSGSSASSSSAVTLPSASRVFDETALENGVRQVLSQSYGLADVTEVRCPAGQAVQVGISFECAVTVAGAQRSVTLRVQTPDGTYQVSAPK
ncbi:hypothetical protein FHX82_004079 [Amycolatopsis bartoniae]|uniref:DUF4333 domain-containing protein n=1 Tax=Amycolatopsis bartoniae TaxID=941986 RepID=UPI00160571F4|nr:DUF4333 domain-containing protein [Amycolatopsis bartoniae]MBB2937015.1 hypothetical protein [Amycolatopsis bartoniae]